MEESPGFERGKLLNRAMMPSLLNSRINLKFDLLIILKLYQGM